VGALDDGAIGAEPHATKTSRTIAIAISAAVVSRFIDFSVSGWLPELTLERIADAGKSRTD
jgi:hypothetical protein